MLDFLPFPKIDGDSVEKKIAQINSYLIQFKEAIEFALGSMSDENKTMSESLAKSLNASNETREDELTQVSSHISRDNDRVASLIEQTAEEIRTEVSKGYELKTDATEMYEKLSSSITQTADSINLSVREQVEETRTYADSVGENAENNANASTDEKLKSYSTTTEMNSAINQKADSITSTVSQSQTKWVIDEESLWVDIYGYGIPRNDNAETNKGKHYLDMETGIVYGTITDGEGRVVWTSLGECEKQTDNIYSKIEQNAYEITQKVSNGKIISTINQTAEEVKINAQKISLEGLITNNNGFEVDKTGYVKMKGADVGGHIHADSVYFHNDTNNIESTFVVQPAYVDISVCDNNYSNPALYTSSVVVGANGLLYLIGRNIEVYEHDTTTWNGSIKFLDTVYNSGGGTAFTSDRNEKNSIEELDAHSTEQFVYSLKPCKFKYNSGNSDRFHHGLIAQEVKKSMGEDDWGLYVRRVDENGTEHLALRYDELIADLIATVQAQNERIKALEEKI